MRAILERRTLRRLRHRGTALTVTAEEIERFLARVRAAAGEVTPQAILERAVEGLAERFPISRASIRMVVPDSAVLEVVAVWSATGTVLGAGARMSLGSTAFPAVSVSGRPELRSRVDPREGLLDEIMAADGIESYVTLPLRDGPRTVGLFSVSSSEPGAFAEADLPGLEALAELVCFAVTKPY